MRFSVISLYPEYFTPFLSQGVCAQALNKSLFAVDLVNPRDFTTDIHKSVDDRPYGGGDGMVMTVEPLLSAMESIAISASHRKIYLSPQGERLSQKKVDQLLNYEQLILVSGRYAGVDQRFLNSQIHEEISIGDYVLSGGELPALVLMDAVIRQIPGVLGNQDSSTKDSLSPGLKGLLEEPTFTRPQEILGQKVPEILLSGDHEKIRKFREKLRQLVSFKKRPDLFLPDQRVKNDLQLFWQELSPNDRKALGLGNCPGGQNNEN